MANRSPNSRIVIPTSSTSGARNEAKPWRAQTNDCQRGWLTDICLRIAGTSGIPRQVGAFGPGVPSVVATHSYHFIMGGEVRMAVITATTHPRMVMAIMEIGTTLTILRRWPPVIHPVAPVRDTQAEVDTVPADLAALVPAAATVVALVVLVLLAAEASVRQLCLLRRTQARAIRIPEVAVRTESSRRSTRGLTLATKEVANLFINNLKYLCAR